MSENQNRSARDFSEYDSMETQELEAILRLDSEGPEGQESDTERILYIAEVLAKRKNAKNTGKTALEAWESFQQNYLPLEEECLEHTQKAAKHSRLRLHRLIAAAAVIALLVGFSVSASAFGWQDVWNTVAKWAKGTFSFVGDGTSDRPEPEGRSVQQQYTSLQEALDATGQKFDLVPTWIPDGYELDKITVYENTEQHVYVAQYKNGEKDMRISLRSFMGVDPEIVEINDDLQEIYEAGGVKYYIFFNDKQLRALWQVGSYECYISGELTMEEIKTMIDSNGKG